MNIIPIDELYNLNYSINVINGLKQYWMNGNSFSCINNPKRVNMLLYADGIKGEYIDKNSEKKYAYPGDIVYTPIGSEYSVKFEKCEPNGNTVGINFFISDENGRPFVFSDDITVFSAPGNANYKALFSKTDKYCEALVPCPGNMKAGMYEVISMLSSLCRSRKPGKFDIIMKGITYLENNPTTDLNISEIADLCNVSTSYFRRLFKEYADVSPMEYVINGRLEKAKLYLEYEDMTVGEISEQLHFTDAAYFSKQFRQRTGMTPMEYRKSKRQT